MHLFQRRRPFVISCLKDVKVSHKPNHSKRCLAKVKKFSDGKIAIDLITDARMTSPKNKELKYMFVNTISDKGLTYLINHKTRKVELTPFGKIKKKHKVLWNGTKTAA